MENIVQVRFFEFKSLFFCNECILLALVVGVRKPIKVYVNSTDVIIGRFAYVCVEVDLIV